MKAKTKYAVLIFILFATLPVLAHTGHKKPQTQTNVAPSPLQTTQTAPELNREEEPLFMERDPKTIMEEAMMSHFHNKIIHFPIALGVTASVLSFFARRRPEMLPVIRILLIVGAIFAVAAYFTGKSQEEPFEESEMHEFLEWHQYLGIASGICLWAGVLISSKAKNLMTLYAVLQLILLSATGFLGGILAHG